jgi:hypothetical protein
MAVLCLSTLAAGPATRPTTVPAELRGRLKLSPAYTQYLDVDGIPIVASAKVSPFALQEARYLVANELDRRGDIAEAIAEAKVRIVVMAANEYTTDVPEHADLMPREYWNLRARGLGATPARPAISCGEENLLELKGDPYRGENILIHEFAHVIHQIGLRKVDPTFDKRLGEAFDGAIAKGLWKGTYAATNKGEYWAEGVQSWFDCNQRPNASHNDVNTRAEIKAYDGGLSKLLEEVFGDREWRYVSPTKREAEDHLKGLNRATLPEFRWPAELLEWKRNNPDARPR